MRTRALTPPAILAFLLLAAGLLAALAVACGDDDDEARDAGPTATSVATEPPEATRGVIDEIDNPPPALTVTTGGEEIEAGLGTFCFGGLCADAIGYITPVETLAVRVQTLTGTLDADAIAEVSASATLTSSLASQAICTGDPEGPLCDETNADRLAWIGALGEGVVVPASADGATVELDVSSLEPGTYVLNLFVVFASGGDASYALVIDRVGASGASLSP